MNEKGTLVSKEIGATTTKANAWRVLAWALFDAGNSAQAVAVSVLLFPAMFKKVLVPESYGDFAWAVLTSSAAVISALVVPVIGAFADIRGTRHWAFTVTTIVCIVSIAAMYFINSDGVLWGVGCFLLASIAYNASFVIYNSYLHVVCSVDTVQRISAVGWAAGYAGGIVVLLLCIPFVPDDLEAGHVGALSTFRLAFLVSAAWFAVLAFPALIAFKERSESEQEPSLSSNIRESYARIVDTARSLNRYSTLVRLMISFFMIANAMQAAQLFTVIIGLDSLGLTLVDVLCLTLVVQFLGIPSTLVCGWIADKVDPKSVLLATLVIWAAGLSFLASGTYPLYVMACVLFGLVVGSTRSVYRSVFRILTPKGKHAEIFGFQNMAAQLSSVFGALAFGAISSATGSQQIACASPIAFLVCGAIILMRLKLASPTEAECEVGDE